MSSQALDKPRPRNIRLPVGLLLSIGAEKPERGPGRAIDHFRPKEGQLAQYAAEAAMFTEHYGDAPKELRDVFFLSNDVQAVLDIRLLAFSTSGIRGVGDTNFATLTDETEFEERVFGSRAFRDGFTFFPKDVGEVRPELRETWEGEPVYGELDGPSDPRVKKLEVKVVTSLEFCLPEIMGLGKVARISTSGRASTRNLYKALWTEWGMFGGHLEGIPFRLALRPRSTQRFVKDEKKYVQTNVYELVLDTPHTVAELRVALQQHRQAFGLPERSRMAIEGRAFREALALPPGREEEETREEPEAEVPSWLLNKIAAMEAELPEDSVRAMLIGVFGVEGSADLDAEQAERYWKMLEAALPAEPVEGEVVDEENGGTGDVERLDPRSDVPPESGEGPGPSHTTAAAGLGDDEPAAPTPDDLPGEPPVEPLPALDVEAAGEMLVPIGDGHKHGKRLKDMPANWIEFAVRPSSARYFEPYPEFAEALEVWAREKFPSTWEERS
ncbi:MAG TPA: hypothetical protein VFW80_08560 [Gaiellaceae bacterium]|nr:hypothetical protein [Gaiellaceae bacterium]